MALDTGAFSQNGGGDVTPGLLGPIFAGPSGPHTLDPDIDVGSALRAAREFRGLTLQDVADTTRVRRLYLAAIEEMRLDQLPSRPFTIGYVRAYARALGVDEEAAVARFKLDAPEDDEPLRAPVGVRREGDPRFGVIAAGAAVLISAVVLWNVAQRAIAVEEPPPPTIPEVLASGAPLPPALVDANPGAPLALGEALPAPAESTIPVPYVTPGLEAATAAGGSADAPVLTTTTTASAPAAAGAAQDPAAVQPVRAAFNPRGTVYGAAPQQSAVTVQARKGASIIVRGADGSVYFARQLTAGEAYRAPAIKGLTLDVSDPAAFDVFVDGELRGVLPAPQTPVSRLQS